MRWTQDKNLRHVAQDCILWGEFYSEREPRLKALLPLVGKDLGLIGTEAAASVPCSLAQGRQWLEQHLAEYRRQAKLLVDRSSGDIRGQRGRARAGAEIDRRIAPALLDSQRFNGAAPVRARRYGEASCAACARCYASTGPRPCGRGDRGGGGGDHRPRPGFNGAAPVRARRLKNSLGSIAPMESFNGAAPVRARRSRGRVTVIWKRIRLQRGRARAGAEIATAEVATL